MLIFFKSNKYMYLDFIKDIFTGSSSSYDKVINRLWIGNYKSGLDMNFLLDNNINLIINCTPNRPFIHDIINEDIEFSIKKKLNSIETIRVSVNDSLLEEDFILMENYFRSLVPLLLKKYTIDKKNILINCNAGKQRSGILIAALLKVLIDNNYIYIDTIPKINEASLKIQFKYIYNYLLTKRPKIFSYGFRVNFKKTYYRYFTN